MRYPAGKFKLWVTRFTNRPDIGPPASLKLVAILCIVSVAWTMWHSVVVELSYSSGVPLEEAAFVGSFFFVFPSIIAWTIFSNLPISRFLIVGYYVGLVATLSFSFIESEPAQNDILLYAAIAGLGLASLWFWLFHSRRMKFYFTIVRGIPLSSDLAEDAESLLPNPIITGKIRQVIEHLVESLEVVVVIAVIVVVFAAYWLMWI